jgi:hypothetical protein
MQSEKNSKVWFAGSQEIPFSSEVLVYTLIIKHGRFPCVFTYKCFQCLISRSFRSLLSSRVVKSRLHFPGIHTFTVNSCIATMPPNPMDQGGQKGKPWPTYFIVRTTGEIVPMIAVDELPPGTNLANVPRQLELEATIGMLNLGLQRGSGAFYQITGVEGGCDGKHDNK